MFRETSFGADGDFSEINLVRRNNSELAQGLGNLVQRVTAMIVKYRNGIIPASVAQEEPEANVTKTAAATVKEVSEAIDKLAFNRALEAIWIYVSRLNLYINSRGPWLLAKRGEDRLLSTVLAQLAEGLRFLSVLVSPFMPTTGYTIATRLGLRDVPKVESLTWGNTLTEKAVKQGQLLFKMLDEPDQIAADQSGSSVEPILSA
jgi:methionyl-tRNA synthetase